MVKYRLYFTLQAQKDAKRISKAGLRDQTEKLLKILRRDPFARDPPHEKLIGDLIGAFSRRINIHHRLVYQVYEKEKAIKAIRLWTHYGE
jgi:Txe/YoeB family toxin of toxin-antitoxin system